jgi:hypothetical protein
MKCNELVLYKKVGKYRRNTKSMWINDAMTEVEWDRKQKTKKSPND